ncbi:nickel pincer cofactor biosynthesis protein LarB [Pseudodesulfovibrio sediminis]|uniref:1-(5-phosphoribosyl)-5-amino-4-imidazole-carboxyl ate carboxylase n=1 Tax=Pseudodesulfovibrio sediminis TaxID=2810563 RepID=A0ABN6EU82_9BACT|nr:nickel pincer cofactor biosynthesis protein LarB [Pseudodesulfovibrio sediminis]BCS89012.1 1-(5-phosphoribosyl)-5-amino-4-imidazole-carboxyl ate carboxylase [Pseudodesulfovibrio sediminis]
MNLDILLDDFEAGNITRDEMKSVLRKQTFVDIGCAKIDHNREARTGGPEVVYCAGKTPDQVATIFQSMHAHNGRVLGTRAAPEHAEAVAQVLDVTYDPKSLLLTIGSPAVPALGKIVVVSAGTSDQPVAEEAAGTAEFLGSHVERHYDCGVAGIHRLFSVMDELNSASAIIAVAGMEGALPSVVGGIAVPPVIALPTSVGYGANFQGLAALLTMMNSCAPGIGVVNIDNGFGAGYLAHKINKMAVLNSK